LTPRHGDDQQQGPRLEITSHYLYFFISYAVAFLVFGLIAKWYVWPALDGRDPKTALTPLLLYATG
jgi:hypothetical protein